MGEGGRTRWGGEVKKEKVKRGEMKGRGERRGKKCFILAWVIG